MPLLAGAVLLLWSLNHPICEMMLVTIRKKINELVGTHMASSILVGGFPLIWGIGVSGQHATLSRWRR